MKLQFAIKKRLKILILKINYQKLKLKEGRQIIEMFEHKSFIEMKDYE